MRPCAAAVENLMNKLCALVMPCRPSVRLDADGPLDPDIWHSKPVWCQPWSILAAGCAGVAASALAFGITGPATLVALMLVLAWWALFLVLLPRSYRRAVEEHNQRLDS